MTNVQWPTFSGLWVKYIVWNYAFKHGKFVGNTIHKSDSCMWIEHQWKNHQPLRKGHRSALPKQTGWNVQWKKWTIVK